MAILKLFWLGPPAIEVDGRPLRLEMRKTLALLAYLSLSPQSSSRETLATMFWSEYDQQHALSSLRRSLTSLKKSLPPGLLETDRERVGLRREDWLEVDVEEFREQLDYANLRSHTKAPACPDRTTALEKAISIYKGDFFEGFNLKDCPEFDEWQFYQRESLRSEYAGAIEKLVLHYASQCQWEKAITHARSWVTLDRLNEPAQRMLISLLARSGQRRAARRQYEELVHLLQEELGQEPEYETSKLTKMFDADTSESKETTSKPAAAAVPLIFEPAQKRVLEPLLKTKLYIPFSKGRKVIREQLFSKLNQIQDYALTILSAPAGFGKTTALAEWIKQSPLMVGWLSLDAADNNPDRFLTYLIAAFQEVESGVGEEALAVLGSSQTIPVRTIVTSLIHDVEKVSNSFVIVLDDYHVIREEKVHEALAFLVDWLPSQAHLVISTRFDPPVSMARLRARGKLLEIRARDLRFTREEIQIFFNEIMELDITSEDLALLDERTEGWAVGLQMAAISLQKSPDKSKIIQAFSGSNRYILDYLLEEVIERQPKYVHDFLLQTSILEQMNGPLCDAMTGIREWNVESEQILSVPPPPLFSQQVLEYLERSNLFVQSLDDKRGWYRYHYLFAELLKARLEQFSPDMVKSLYRRASEWHELNGFIPAAVRYALASKSFNYAAEVIDRAIRTNLIWSSGDLALMLSWVDALPIEVLNLNPLIRIYLSSALYVTGDFKRSNQIIEEVGKSLPETLKTIPNPVFVEQLYLSFRVLHEATKGEISKAAEDFLEIQALDSGDEFVKFYSRNYLLLAYLVAGDVKNALHIAPPSYEAFIKERITLQALSNAKNTADVYILQGRLNDAIDICQEVIERCKLSEVRTPVVGIVGLSIGAVHFERNELKLAEKYVQDSLDLLAKGPIRNDFGQGYALLAMIKQAQGDQRGALQMIDRALQAAEYAEIPRIIHLIQAYQARIWLAQGAVDLASNWVKDYCLIGSSEYPREVEDIILAQVFIQQKRYAEAGNLLDNLLVKAGAARRDGRTIEILILLSVALSLQNRIVEALDLLEESLRKACQERYVRVYLDKGEPVRYLLSLYKEKRDEESINQLEVDELYNYVGQLLFAFEGE